MPHIDFSVIEDTGTYAPVPEGRYRAEIIDVEESATRNGDELWKLTLSIAEGDSEGRRIFDNLVFSPKAMPRVKMICSRLGVDVSGRVDLKPDALIGKTCVINVEVHEYVDGGGRTRETNRIPFAGYEQDTTGGGGAGDDDDAVPF